MTFDADRYLSDLALRVPRRAPRVSRKRCAPPDPGFRSGRLVVLNYNPISQYCECLCDCGNKHYVHARSIRTKHTRSCGCLRKK